MDFGNLNMRLGGSQRGSGPSTPASPYLDSVLDSVVFDIDATMEDSYNGSGTLWKNLIENPADSELQADYDFTVYLDNVDFVGSAGSAAAYFNLKDAEFGDYDFFDLSGVNTDLINALHKTTGGEDFWVALALRHIETTGNRTFFSTQGGPSNQGLRGSIGNSQDPVLTQRGDSSGVVGSSGEVITDGELLLIITRNQSTGTTRFYINSLSPINISHSFNATTTDATNKLRIGSVSSSTNKMPENTRLYHFSMGNEFLDDEKAAAIIAHLEARHNRTYVPE